MDQMLPAAAVHWGCSQRASFGLVPLKGIQLMCSKITFRCESKHAKGAVPV